MATPGRGSDRWITPASFVGLVAILAVVVIVIAAGLVYLASIGRDPGPVLDLVTQIVTAAGSLTAAVVTIATRATATKTERNLNSLAREVEDVRYTVEDTTRVALPYPPVPERGTAPAATGR